MDFAKESAQTNEKGIREKRSENSIEIQRNTNSPNKKVRKS